MEEVKGSEDDVNSKNGVSESKTSYPFLEVAFNHLPTPLVFPKLWSGA